MDLGVAFGAVSGSVYRRHSVPLARGSNFVVVVDRLIGSLVGSLDVGFAASLLALPPARVVVVGGSVPLARGSKLFDLRRGIFLVWYLLVVDAGNTDSLICSTATADEDRGSIYLLRQGFELSFSRRARLKFFARGLSMRGRIDRLAEASSNSHALFERPQSVWRGSPRLLTKLPAPSAGHCRAPSLRRFFL